ncbi:DUF1648 domain-containing protein [Microbacterium fluvii]|uniref:DUF1648 domain-containing protein n=1 Tax=Microbacterium fluvii TaxID=415215 RepID=A0ABW2HCY3_9MICO|nr:DUF1648 domain-containing protein [Microbacterium fluvii]MCU4672352.1 DUF1648 domain-containing protein [Microbacterium fluvii]
MTAERPPLAVRRFVLVAIALPIVLTVAAVIVQLIALPLVPSPIAIHWGVSGAPDAFGPAWLQPVVTVVIGLGIPLGIALTSVAGLRRGDRGGSYRLMGAVAAGTSVLGVVLLTWMLVVQVGLDDAASAGSILVPGVVSIALAVLAGVGAWFLQPKEQPQHRGAAVDPLVLAPGERAVWLGTAALSRAASIAIAAACAVLVLVAIAMWIFGAPLGAAVLISILALVMVALAATTVVFHVRVDADGLTVTSIAGLPRFRVGLSDIVEVGVSQVNPMGEFGGWGLRSAPGRFGIVLRTGEAIEVTRRSGRRFVVTVDDAATGAALLSALAERAGSLR